MMDRCAQNCLGRILLKSLGVMVVVSFSLLLSPAESRAGEEVTVNGVLHVRNGASPDHGLRTLRLEELWRAGGAADDETIFGLITRVRADEQGLVYLLDSQLQQVSVYDPSGELIHTLFGEGEGPGEIQRAGDLVCWPSGAWSALRRFPGGLVTVSPDGTPRSNDFGTAVAGGSFESIQAGGGNLVLGGVERPSDVREFTSTQIFYLASFSAGGEELVRYHQTEWSADYSNDFVFRESKALNDFLYCFAVGEDGRVYVPVSRNEYQISVFQRDGSLERVIEREFQPRQRTAAETQRMQAMAERRFRTFPWDLTYDLEAVEATFAWYHRAFQLTADGELWVRHSRSASVAPAGSWLTLDVFDTTGHFREQVAVPGQCNALFDSAFRVGSNLLVVVRGYVDAVRTMVGGGQGALADLGDEPEPIEVICYRILE